MSEEAKAIGKCIGYARNEPEWNALDALAAADAELAALVARAETAEAHVAELVGALKMCIRFIEGRTDGPVPCEVFANELLREIAD